MRNVRTQGDFEDVEVGCVAGLDLGKAELVCCVRTPDPNHQGRVTVDVTTWTTMTNSLTQLADSLVEQGVHMVAMEATSDYWKPVFYRLEAHGLNVIVVNAKHFKHLPGRPKTDKLDAQWLARLAGKGLLKPSFIPPVGIRRLRDLTRDRADLVDQRTANKNRVEKLLEDGCIKLSVVASDIFGVSGRAMMEALIMGQRDPVVLADMARGKMRNKHCELIEALNGMFSDHHGFRLRLLLDRIDALTHDIAILDRRIDDLMEPYSCQRNQLAAIPGVGYTNAAVILSEIGVDMTRFVTAGHLTSWAKYSPGVHQSAGKQKGSGSTGKGNRYLARALGQSAVASRRTQTFLGERYRRLARRVGKLKAQTAIGRSMLVGIWHLLQDPTTSWIDLGPDHYHQHHNPDRSRRNHVKALEALGYTVTLQQTD
jgi:transposase